MTNESTPYLTIVGLGPGLWSSLTVEAADTLLAAQEILVRDVTHPAVAALRPHLPALRITGLPAYAGESHVPQSGDRQVDAFIERALQNGSVTFAVPGNPVVDDPLVHQLLKHYRSAGILVKVIPGLSSVDSILHAANTAALAWLQVIDAGEAALYGTENAVGEVAGREDPLPWRAPTPTVPLVITALQPGDMVASVRRWLGAFYPPEHHVVLVAFDGEVRRVALAELTLTAEERFAGLLVPALPEIENVRTFAGMMQLTRRLRGPGGCPWDREQTNATLKPYLLEEAYEVEDALDSGDPTLIAEEFGDLLYQITLHAQVAAEGGVFTIEDVIQNIVTKLIGRHPHVFADLELGSAQEVRDAWESFKQRQKPTRTSILQEIPRGLPALPQSNLMQKRAASVGFAWPSVAEVLAKVEEEVGELARETGETATAARRREELGDVLFALVGVARLLRIDPEEALRLANRKFAARFGWIEVQVAAHQRSVRDLSPSELHDLWQQAKRGTAASEA